MSVACALIKGGRGDGGPPSSRRHALASLEIEKDGKALARTNRIGNDRHRLWRDDHRRNVRTRGRRREQPSPPRGDRRGDQFHRHLRRLRSGAQRGSDRQVPQGALRPGRDHHRLQGREQHGDGGLRLLDGIHPRVRRGKPQAPRRGRPRSLPPSQPHGGQPQRRGLFRPARRLQGPGQDQALGCFAEHPARVRARRLGRPARGHADGIQHPPAGTRGGLRPGQGGGGGRHLARTPQAGLPFRTLWGGPRLRRGRPAQPDPEPGEHAEVPGRPGQAPGDGGRGVPVPGRGGDSLLCFGPERFNGHPGDPHAGAGQTERRRRRAPVRGSSGEASRRSPSHSEGARGGEAGPARGLPREPSPWVFTKITFFPV